MAWCPQCKNEYREGIKTCVDCGCDLVEEEQYDDLVPLTFGDEEKLNSLKKYLVYNKLKGVTVKFDETEGVYELFVRKDDKGPASAMARVFLQQEMLREIEEKQKMETDEQAGIEKDDEQENGAKKENTSAHSTVYFSNNERAADNRSSAWTLLGVGTVGLIAMILGMLEVIPLRLGNPYMFYGVMCAVFLLFIVMGVVSMKNAKIFAKKAESENTLREAMIKWYQETLNADALDLEIGAEEETADELLYFRRVQMIKDKFNHQFMNLDQVFLEHFIDEEVYDYIYSEKER